MTSDRQCRKNFTQAPTELAILMNITPLDHRGLSQPHSVPNLTNAGQDASPHGGIHQQKHPTAIKHL